MRKLRKSLQQGIAFLDKGQTEVYLWTATFAVLLFPNLFTYGEFLDGLFYGSISRNLSIGVGQLWLPYYFDMYPDGFIDHPPLFFWLESLWFGMVGDWHFTEKIYSLLWYLICSLVLYKVSRRTFDQSLSILTVFLWTITPVVFWTFQNNMMEMVLTALILVSFLVLVNRHQNEKAKKWYDLPLVGLLFLLTFLTKGPIALGILMLPICFIISRSLLDVLKELFVINFFGLGFLILLLLYEPAAENLSRWFDSQIIGVLSGDRAIEFADSRIKLLSDLGQLLLAPLAVCVTSWIFFRKNLNVTRNGISVLFAALLFSLPFLISRKQHAYYLVPSLAFYSLYLVTLFRQNLTELSQWLNQTKTQWLKPLCLLIFISSIIVSLTRFGVYSRDIQMQKDLKLIHKVVGDNQRIEIGHDVKYNWSLHGYAMRYYKLSLVLEEPEYYFLSESSVLADKSKVDIQTERFHLFKSRI